MKSVSRLAKEIGMRFALIVLAICCAGCSASVRPTVYPTLDSIRDVQMQQGMTRAQKEAELIRRYGVEVRRFGGRVADSEGTLDKNLLSGYFRISGIHEAKRELEKESNWMGPAFLLAGLGPLAIYAGGYQGNSSAVLGGVLATTVGFSWIFELEFRAMRRSASIANKWLGDFLVEDK